jgi:TetR/AcrR family transcriptional repressor of nem operon
MVDMLQRSAVSEARSARASALAIAALCVGGMVVAKASHDAAFADELREAAKAAALELGGWDGGIGPDPAQPRVSSARE